MTCHAGFLKSDSQLSNLFPGAQPRGEGRKSYDEKGSVKGKKGGKGRKRKEKGGKTARFGAPPAKKEKPRCCGLWVHY